VGGGKHFVVAGADAAEGDSVPGTGAVTGTAGTHLAPGPTTRRKEMVFGMDGGFGSAVWRW